VIEETNYQFKVKNNGDKAWELIFIKASSLDLAWGLFNRAHASDWDEVRLSGAYTAADRAQVKHNTARIAIRARYDANRKRRVR